MRHLLAISAVLLCLFSACAAVAADVVPGDDACKPWQHWEGAHDGECATGCTVATPSATLDPWTAGIGGLLASLVVVRARRRR